MEELDFCILWESRKVLKMHNSIKNLPESERPYEKFVARGAEALSDAELIAIILKTGTKSSTAVDVAVSILEGGHNNILNLCDITIDELMQINGIGQIKAIQLKAVCELSKRISMTKSGYQIQMMNPGSIADYYMEQLRHLKQEVLMCAFFDTKCKFLGDMKLSTGSVNYSYVSPGDILRSALLKNATQIILLHNHPSGDPDPSNDDIRVTERVREGARLIGIILADHVIIGDNQYFSFKENNYI